MSKECAETNENKPSNQAIKFNLENSTSLTHRLPNIVFARA